MHLREAMIICVPVHTFNLLEKSKQTSTKFSITVPCEFFDIVFNQVTVSTELPRLLSEEYVQSC